MLLYSPLLGSKGGVEKILLPRGRVPCRAGDLDIALLNAVVSALARAAQWQQARVKNDLRFMVPVVLVEKNRTLSWESKRTLENSCRIYMFVELYLGCLTILGSQEGVLKGLA